MTELADRMRAAADTLEEAARLYDAIEPLHYPWTAAQLRAEAEYVEVPF
jgi:hypothetical protein